MDVRVSLEDAIPVLTLTGRFDGAGAGDFDQRVSALEIAGVHWVIDMSGVSYLSSLGIRSLVALDTRLKARDGGLVLAGLAPLVLKVLQVSRLDQCMQIVATPDDAFERARASAAAGPAVELILSTCKARVRRQPGASTIEWWAGDAALNEMTAGDLGFAFGAGALGGASADSDVGAFISTPQFTGIVGPGADSIADFVVGDALHAVPMTVASALALSGTPVAVVELEGAGGFSLPAALDELFDRENWTNGSSSPAALGFAVLGHAAGSATGLIATGVVLDAASARNTIDPEARLERAGSQMALRSGRRLAGRAVTLNRRPSLDSRADLDVAFNAQATLDALGAIVELDACGRLTRAIVWVFAPSAVLSGVGKQLQVNVDGGEWRPEWNAIVRRLYQDCRSVTMTPLPGGFMSSTFKAVAYDRDGRRTLPSVVKIGPTELTRREQQANRDYVLPFILNNGTTVLGDAQHGDWAGLRYNFVGVNGPDTRLTWLYDHYLNRPVPEAMSLFEQLFTRVLKPWYAQPKWEQVFLFRDHTPLRLFPTLIETAEQLFGVSADDPEFDCPELGTRLPNPFRFLKHDYPRRASESRLWYTAVCHGDLNLRNVLVDERDNLYVIDFSETHVRNAVSDFGRLEPVLKFEMTRVETDDDLRRMLEFEEALTSVKALDEPPPLRYTGSDPLVPRAHAGVTLLRRCADRATLFERDLVPYWLAVLEWTYSTVCYRQLSPRQKRYAACSAALICRSIQQLEGTA